MFVTGNGNIAKEYELVGQRLTSKAYVNKITGRRIELQGEEFALSYGRKKGLFYKKFTSSDCMARAVDKDVFELKYEDNDGTAFKIIMRLTVKDNYINKTFELFVNRNVFIDYIELERFSVPEGMFSWSVPMPKKRIYVPNYIATLGQPVYVDSMFFGVESSVGDNRIDKGTASYRYHIGRMFNEVANEASYVTASFVAGAGIGARLDMVKRSFFDYIHATSRNPRFRMQYNSWYDHMLDISSENIKKEFVAVHDGLTSHGLRNLDCYVVDDGWVDYKKKEFWAFRDDRFPDKFNKESQLTKELGSTFGVWFGPRGGYTEQLSYARNLTSLGYHICKQSFDICTGDPKYIHDLTDKMIEFVKEYNVTYFKIDGFAITPCRSRKHSHPVGGHKGIYFYTFLWEEWLKGFDRIHAVNNDVFLNITSYTHCSPWFMRWADAVWINNASDMAYEGEGSDLDQCLNYRDGRYYDFAKVRQLQFPVAYIYNHEPCYGKMNYNPPLPNKTHRTVTYTAEEFEKYMYACMMRGTGFIELYFSPEMFDDAKWNIAVKVLKWAEENFDIIKNSCYFGGVPKNGEVYGYYAMNGDDVIFSVRNPSANNVKYSLDNEHLSFRHDAYSLSEIYPSSSDAKHYEGGEKIDISLKPFEMKIFRLRFDKK